MNILPKSSQMRKKPPPIMWTWCSMGSLPFAFVGILGCSFHSHFSRGVEDRIKVWSCLWFVLFQIESKHTKRLCAFKWPFHWKAFSVQDKGKSTVIESLVRGNVNQVKLSDQNVTVTTSVLKSPGRIKIKDVSVCAAKHVGCVCVCGCVCMCVCIVCLCMFLCLCV